MFRLVFISAVIITFFGCATGTLFARRLRPFVGRIVGGKNVAIEEYPYQLSFEVLGRHFCGASLVKPNVAVTAAHCTRGLYFFLMLGLLTVRAGTPIRGRGGLVAHVVDLCDHPKFDGLDYDVSVLQLDEAFPISSRIQIIPLQPRDRETPTGTLATVSGWGAVMFRGSGSDVLKAVEVPRVTEEACRRSYPNRIKTRMVCFGYSEGGKDSCQGDSGGPLVVDRRLVGIVSFGRGCARPETPGVYTKVADPEIYDHINMCVDAMYF